MKQIKQLRKNKINRYELDELTELRCGDVIDVFVFEQEEKGKWVTVTIEHDGKDYYAVEYKNLCLQGLWAKIDKQGREYAK